MKRSTFILALTRLKDLGVEQQMILTGSNVLRVNGLIPWEDEGSEMSEGDLDIVIKNPNDDTVKKLQQLQHLLPARTKPINNEHYTNIIAIVQIPLSDGTSVKMDFFGEGQDYKTQPCFLQSPTYYNGKIELASIEEIIKKKKSYKRDKDYEQLSEWARLFWDKEEEFLQKIRNMFRNSTTYAPLRQKDIQAREEAERKYRCCGDCDNKKS